MSGDGPHYAQEFIDRLETLWGEGFLSPGGGDEVRQILDGLDLSGKTVLDIGCGTGGAELVLAADLGAGTITAIDVEEEMITRTGERVSSVDRNAWYARLTVHEVRQLEGPLRERIIEVSDEETYGKWLTVRRALRDSALAGALRPTHLRGYKTTG